VFQVGEQSGSTLRILGRQIVRGPRGEDSTALQLALQPGGDLGSGRACPEAAVLGSCASAVNSAKAKARVHKMQMAPTAPAPASPQTSRRLAKF